jgi:hypothetical protein
MECNTARLLLAFSRPRTSELDAEEARELEAHLLHCPVCAVHAGGEHRLDAQLGKAMAQVEVPAQLRGSIQTRLDSRRAEWSRRRARRLSRRSARRWYRVAAVAAAMLLAVGGAWLWWVNNLPAVKMDQVYDVVQRRGVTPVSREQVTADLQARYGVNAVLPDFNYNMWTCTALVDFQGTKVPLLIFRRNNQAAHAYAEVYVLSARQFNLKDLLSREPASAGSVYKVEVVVPSDRSDYAYLVIYTGENLDWLKPERAIQ